MAEAQFWLPRGAVVGDRYQLESVLGVGGYGITYKGIDTRLNRLVAVKEYYPSFWCSRFSERGPEVHCMNSEREAYLKGMDRFLEEAKTLVALADVPEVVSVSDYFEENSTAYLVMEFLDGRNLKQMADGFGGRIPPEVLIPVLEPLVKALGKVHEKGMIHRDLSPDNIMMLEDGNTRLIDFGNARDASNQKSMTLAMKQGFAAPEQYKSKGQGTYTDVYGLCATMYYCMTGKLAPQPMERLMGAAFPTPTELGIAISPQWEQAVLDGLELYVQKRIQNMEELWQRLYAVTPEPSVSSDVYCESVSVDSYYPKTEPQTVAGTDTVQNRTGHTESVIMRDHERAIGYFSGSGKGKESENFVQSGLERIRNICMQIYQKMKEM